MGASHVEKDGATDSLFLQFSDVLPIQYEDFFVLSLGRVDRRSSYHTKNQIWPVGYRSCWHDKVSGSLFVCDVLDGGHHGPVFKVSRSSCSTLPIPSGSTFFVASNHDQNKEMHDNVAGFNFDEEENSSLQMLISDPPTENDSRCCLGNSCGISASDSSISKDEIGEFSVEESSPYLAWRTVAKKFVDTLREIYMHKSTFSFCCEHVADDKDEENYTSLAKFSGSSGTFKAPSINDDGLNIETVLEGVRTWLDQDRFGLEVEFVQEILELLPGVGSCSLYTPLKRRSCYSTSVTVGNALLLAKTTDGELMTGDKALCSLFAKCKKAETDIVQDTVMKSPNLPVGKPLCTKVLPEIAGDVIQVLEFFGRFSEVLYVGDIISVEQLEMELASPSFNNHENSSIETSYTSALNIVHMSLLNVLNSELQAKVGAVGDPSSDIRDFKPKRGRKKNMDLSVSLIGNPPNMLPLNELTWPELARRYILAMLCMDDNADTLQSGKVYRCLLGDGGDLCVSLIGILGMEADALLLAQAIKKIFGWLDKEYDMLTVADGNDQPSAFQGSSPPEGYIPEWAQLLEPVRKLPTNVGARIKKCVNAALDKGPPEWAKKILENSISKEVYKGNACGPTKKAVVSVLATVCGEGERQKTVNERNKPDELKKGRNYISIRDIITRQCRITLRKVANADGGKLFCNLLSWRLNNFVESEDEGFLRCPAHLSCPLDFRTIDLRLAVGAYDGSHEAFLEDVQEFWNHVRNSYGEKPDLLLLAEKLLSKFEELYEKEVLAIYQKLSGYARLGCLTAEVKKEVDEFIISSSVLPKAPWESGICKICGIDKNDDLVLLCDTCDAEYHTYCLIPPLMGVPQGNWHCPSCVFKQDDGKAKTNCDSVNLGSKRNSLGEFTGFRFNALKQLASLLEDKDCWEFSVKERIFLLKFLTDELLNSGLIRQHLEHSMEASADLQQKLRFAYIDLRNMKQREYILAENFAKISKDSQFEASELYENASSLPRGPMDISLGDSTEPNTELNSLKNGFFNLRDSIGSLEKQLMKLSGRREFLGADSAGRLYWVWAKLERQLGVIVNDVTKAYSASALELNEEATLCSPWVVYQSPLEIKELVSFLRDDDPRERELKGSILQRLKISFQEGENEGSDDMQNAFSGNSSSDSKSLATKAADLLESKYGRWFQLEIVLMNKKAKNAKVISDNKLFRCDCLEPVFPSRYHCLSCHKSFVTKREADDHNEDQCKSGLTASSQSKSRSSSKSGSFVLFPKLNNIENDGLVSPYNFEDICSKFVTMDSLKDLVREIGFLGSNGFPLFLSSVSPNLSDPTLKLNVPPKDVNDPTGENKTDHLEDNSKGLLGSSSGANPAEFPGSDKPENASSDKKGANCCIISKSALKPLVGKAYRVLIQLKMNLLDMEAALPKSAVRVSKACIKRRWAWRSFVKSAGTIDEMVQAVIGFEDMIKINYLKNGWWYWSSLSAAAKISSLSGLALRIYSLDDNIVYDKIPVSFNVSKSDAAESVVLARKVKRKLSG